MTIYNISQSTEINYGKHCKLTQKIENFAENETSLIIKISSKFVKPNFEIFSNKSWKNVEFIDENYIETLKIINEIKENRDYFEKNSKILNFNDYDYFLFLPNFLFNTVVSFILLYIVLPIMIILLLTYCICRYTK